MWIDPKNYQITLETFSSISEQGKEFLLTISEPIIRRFYTGLFVYELKLLDLEWSKDIKLPAINFMLQSLLA
ncbi:hypothetical protein K502DRAFT_322765 [Neoconidiobolus thromboides FSU 785]|nr:hypothetical protein K502DRAFT_322765 [Neoconidiobolus thromboides FSU 785]